MLTLMAGDLKKKKKNLLEKSVTEMKSQIKQQVSEAEFSSGNLKVLWWGRMQHLIF